MKDWLAYELASLVVDHDLSKLRQEGVITMPKDMPTKSGDTDRKPWKKKPYPIRLIGSEEIDNRYYLTPSQLDEKYGERAEGEDFWRDPSKPSKDREGNTRDWTPLWHDESAKTQYRLKFEVVDGDKKGDWHFEFADKKYGYKKDGTIFGKRGKIADAMGHDIALGIEEDNSDLIGGMCMAVMQPKGDDGKYAKATEFYPMEDADKLRFGLGAEVTVKEGPVTADDLEEDIPFAVLPRERRATTRNGHERYSEFVL